jgi:hypothetical protein
MHEILANSNLVDDSGRFSSYRQHQLAPDQQLLTCQNVDDSLIVKVLAQSVEQVCQAELRVDKLAGRYREVEH